ncbi:MULTISPECIES: PadR family transcriptional regulator [unclassified Streptomyces]|uniref:PadR family transcriptional regulator n=1 Tax=unclassified Streptomyces TaxID=2593676 RepID=UPI002E24E570|nr:PadR family transcriptional regulator [Streptomyces sp. NBC_01023]
MERGKARQRTSEKVESQLRKGVLEYCVLALMRDGPTYGVELLCKLQDTKALTTSQGTVYSLLSRLRRDELVITTWQESASGPPRRYCALADSGHAALEEFTGIWPGFRDAVDHLLQPHTPHQPDPGKAHP